MFTVKATYRNETRRFTFPDSVLFPTYDDLHHQVRDLVSRLAPASAHPLLALSTVSHQL